MLSKEEFLAYVGGLKLPLAGVEYLERVRSTGIFPSRAERRDEHEKGSRLPPLPVAVFPTHTMRRISAQRSCFTIHGSERNGFDKVTEGKKSVPLVKFEIPSWEVLQIRRSLGACGIDDTAIFPDLQALGRAVTSNWIGENRRLPHEGVYTRINDRALMA